MADNVQLSLRVGDGAIIATDDIGGVQFPKTKITIGADGVNDGDVSSANPLPVSLGSVIAGTGPTNLGKAIDSAAGITDTVVAVGVVRDDALSALTPIEGDYVNLRVDANGALWTIISGTVTVASHAVTNAGTFAVQVSSIAAGDNNIGNVDIVTVPADPFGANADAASATGSISAKLRFIASTGIPITGTVTVGSHAVTNAGTFAVQESGAALTALQLIDNACGVHAAPAVTGVRQIGLEGRNTEPTVVAGGDSVRAIATLLGKQVVVPYAIPASTWNYAAASGGIVNTTGVTAKAAAGASIRNYVTRAQIINGHATVSTDVQIRDGASGTVLWRGWAQAGGGGVTAVFDPPLKGTANTLIEVACGTTGTATYVNLQGYIAAE